MGLEEGRAAAYAEGGGRVRRGTAGRGSGGRGVGVSVRTSIRARERRRALTLAQEHALRALNDGVRWSICILGVTGMPRPADLDVLLARLTSVAGRTGEAWSTSR